MTASDIKFLIAGGESLTVEFKGEEREAFNDRALYENVVCLANGEGGTLLIGVEDDGRITGARPRHGATTEAEMIILNSVFRQRRAHTEEMAALIQKPTGEARRVLENLAERGWLEAKGEKKGRVYHFAPAIYERLGQPEAYVRYKGISAARHQAMVEEFARAHGKVVRQNVVELCDLNGPQAGRLLKKMVNSGKLIREGPPRRWSTYHLPPSS